MTKKRTLGIRDLRREYKQYRFDPDSSWSDDLPTRPRTRAECKDGIRPCPFVGCRYNLWCEVTENGSLVILNRDVDPTEVPPEASCALDIADRVSGQELETGENQTMPMSEIGRIYGVGGGRIQQIVESALDHYLAAIGDSFGD